MQTGRCLKEQISRNIKIHNGMDGTCVCKSSVMSVPSLII